MIRTYNIEGMTCAACTQIVHDRLSKVAGVKNIKVDLAKAQADLTMNKPLTTASLQAALEGSLHQLSETDAVAGEKQDTLDPKKRLEKNKRLVSGYVKAVGQLQHTLLDQYIHPDFTFNGALTLHSARDFIAMIKEHAAAPTAGVLLKNDIKAIFVDGNESYVIYDAVTDCQVGAVRFVEWITIKDGKILSTDVKFDRYRMKQLMREVRKMTTKG